MPSVPDFEIPTRHIVPPADVPNVLRPEFLSGDTAAAARHAEIVDRIVAGRELRAAEAAAEAVQPLPAPKTLELSPFQSKALAAAPKKAMDVVIVNRSPAKHFVKSSCSWCGGWLRSGEVRIHPHCVEIEARAKANKR